MPLEVPDFIEMSPMNESEPQDPFAQMQAELSAELGSMSAALALDPAPVFDALPQAYPSDQVLAPSLLEALPIAEEHAAPAPEATVPIAAATPAPTAAETPGQLVNFDARRSRRNKKNAKAGAGERPAAATPPPAPVPVAAKVTPIVDARPAAAESISLPPGTLAEAELAGAAVRKGVPAWVWVALALLVVAAGYFAFTRFTSLGSEAAASAPPQETQVAERQAEPAPAQAPATTKPSDQHELVLNSIDPLPSRTAPPAPDASPPLAKATPAASTKTADTIPPHMFPVVPDKPSKNLRTAPHAAEPQTLSAPVGADEGVASVDPAPEPSAAAANAAPAVTPGALVDPEEVDTTPVSLARKVPIYSMQARQLRIQGTVIMKVLVNERGTVDDVVLVQGVSGADLNDSAMRAAKSWTYRPATKAGVPVKAWKVEQVTFKL
jgi:protein TonB